MISSTHCICCFAPAIRVSSMSSKSGQKHLAWIRHCAYHVTAVLISFHIRHADAGGASTPAPPDAPQNAAQIYVALCALQAAISVPHIIMPVEVGHPGTMHSSLCLTTAGGLMAMRPSVHGRQCLHW